jgi:GT2 family glycosyltransferase
MDVPSFGVCILSHGSSIDTVELLEELFLEHEVPHAVVVENGANPLDVERFEELALRHPKLTVIESPNLGYSSGNNLGLRTLMNKGCEWGVVFNPDVRPTGDQKIADWIKASVAAGCTVSGPMIYDASNRVVNPLDVLSPFNAVVPMPTKRKSRIHATTGCALALNLGAFFDLGGFDEGFFLYREEQALGYKLEANHQQWFYYQDFEVYHHHRRKVESLRSWLAHRKWEFQSTLRIFAVYQKRSRLGIWSYQVLFVTKSALYLLMLPFFARR